MHSRVVDTRHYRRVLCQFETSSFSAVYMVEAPEARELNLRDEYELLPRGGATIVDIFDDEGNCLATGVAQCSNKDNFSKKRGRDIALGRAVKQLKGES